MLVIDEASMLSVPQMLWLVKYARESDSRVLLVGDSAQHRSVERGDALRILEQSGTVRVVELLQTQRQKVPALKAAIEDLKADRLQAGWERLERHGVIKEVIDVESLRERAVEQHLKALRSGKTSLMISPRHEEARKVAAIVRRQLKGQGAIGAEDYSVKVLRRLDLGRAACRDILHYPPGRVIGFHTRTAGGFRPGEKWAVKETNCETVTLERNGKTRQFKPSAKGKWDLLVSSTMQVSVGAGPSSGYVEAAIHRSNHALSLGGAPSGNSSRDGNGALRPLSSSDARIILPDRFPMRRSAESNSTPSPRAANSAARPWQSVVPLHKQLRVTLSCGLPR
jgi:hypothetical protein